MFEKAGKVTLFLFQGLIGILSYFFSKNKIIRKNFIDQFYSFGVRSFPMVFIVSFFMGMVLVVQLVPEFKKFGAESFTGGTIAIAIARELGPTITAIIIAGRVGSAIAAELGSMKVTEQIAALEVMAINPITYIVSPRIFAGMVMLPMITMMSEFFSLLGAYLIGIYKIGLVPSVFFSNITMMVKLKDVLGGLLKTVFFGIIITSVSCYKGMSVEGGAEGVGEATTEAVVTSIMYLLVFNFFISLIIFGK